MVCIAGAFVVCSMDHLSRWFAVRLPARGWQRRRRAADMARPRCCAWDMASANVILGPSGAQGGAYRTPDPRWWRSPWWPGPPSEGGARLSEAAGGGSGGRPARVAAIVLAGG